MVVQWQSGGCMDRPQETPARLRQGDKARQDQEDDRVDADELG
jgi:hypothetical protein